MALKNNTRHTNGHTPQVVLHPIMPYRVAHTAHDTADGADRLREPQLLAILPAMLFTCRADGAWDYVNPPFCAAMGRPAEMLTGLGWADALHADDRAIGLNRWQAGISSGAPFQVEHQLRGADGAYHWLRIQCAPWRNAAGTITRWAGIATPDETEAALAAERARRRDAEAACAERDSMIAITAHELRAPLTVLMGQARLLQRRLDARESADPGDRRASDALVAQTLRLKELIGALLDVTQIDHGQLRVCATTLDLGALVRRVAQALQPTLRDHTLRVCADPAPLWVAGDALRLEQVLQNLLQNAVKYSPHGGEIVIQATLHGDQVQIDVRDQGMGIPAHVQPYLFQRFFRVRADDRRMMAGLGLGLYICKAIMDLHNGSIEVESAVGAGSTVTLRLPRIPLQPLGEPGAHDASA